MGRACQMTPEADYRVASSSRQSGPFVYRLGREIFILEKTGSTPVGTAKYFPSLISLNFFNDLSPSKEGSAKGASGRAVDLPIIIVGYLVCPAAGKVPAFQAPTDLQTFM